MILSSPSLRRIECKFAGPLLFLGIFLLQLIFRALELPAAFVTVIKLYIEVLGLIVWIFFGQPDAMIHGDIPDRSVTAKGATNQMRCIHVPSY